jgi:plasmid stability protein
MSSIIVRGLDDAVKQQLAAQAKEHGRSMEAEVRAILTKAARRPHIGIALLAAAQDVGGVEDLPIPGRDDVARAVEFE